MVVNKLRRFSDIKDFPNVLEPPQDIKGNWNAEHFHNDFPITLELACGKAEQSLALARKNKKRNYIGVDRKGARIWKGAKIALDESLVNIAFLRVSIEDLLDFFQDDEVDEIWITFPDPFPRTGKAKKRLTSTRFLKIYESILKPGHVVHLKTDDYNLFNFTLDMINESNYTLKECIEDIYQVKPKHPAISVQTYYESLHITAGKKIHYLRFSI